MDLPIQPQQINQEEQNIQNELYLTKKSQNGNSIPLNFSNYLEIKCADKKDRNSLEESLEQINFSQLIRQCRICLEEENNGQLYSPCRCVGSVAYVHQDCLKRWIINSMKRELNREKNQRSVKYMKCQICKQNIKFIFLKKSICANAQQIKSNIKNYLISFVILWILIVATAFGFIYLVQFLSTSHSEPFFTVENLLAIGAVAILVICCTLSIYFLTSTFLFWEQRQIEFPNSIKRGPLKRETTLSSIYPINEEVLQNNR